MSYTIKISDTESKLAENLVSYLKSLSETSEYQFIQVTDDSEVDQVFRNELDNRYKHFLDHREEFLDWDAVKLKYAEV